jgi:hypothetical protein
MKSLNVYTVHINTKGKTQISDIENVVILKEGFALWAFLFHFFWLFYKRVWIPGIVVFLAFMLLGGLEQSGTLSTQQGVVIQIGLVVYIGFCANDWLRKTLEIQGYTFAGVVTARDGIEAYQRFFDRYTHSQAYHVVPGSAVVAS